MIMDDAGLTHAIWGGLTICLNEFNGLMNHEVKLPIECDSETDTTWACPKVHVELKLLR